MRKCERAFTLIEMLVVLMIISILLLIALPSMTKNNEVAANKGCEATVKLLQTQVHAYEIENKNTKLHSLDTLVKEGYVDSIECPNGEVPTFEDGVVSAPNVTNGYGNR